MLVCVAMLVGARRAAGLQARAALAGAMRRGPMRGARALAAEPAGGGRVSAAVVQKKSEEKQEKLELTPPRGTRDFYPEELRVRDWLFGKWRAVAALHGFEEYDAPVLESEALYIRKAGEEVTQQLYNFEDKGGRRVTLRPEMTPSLARMVMARRGGLALPLKWFAVPQCWRYERATRGRRREHYQWNMDVWGVPGVAAEAELLGAMVSFFESVGLTSKDVGIKVNSRRVLAALLERFVGVAADDTRFASACVLVDKLEKVPPSALHADFALLGVAADQVDSLHAALFAPGAADAQAHGHATGSLAALKAAVCDSGDAASSAVGAFDDLAALDKLANAHGYADWLVYDASVVRGLAYYTGAVFEAFDR
ncbi:hypothetical protein M885DRAFT_603235 [Pelagophyceae sp. CCMP2097]|nr:hypothetical protein M885DRAFT_603235 [Pelagophyceae sp. CCMP2097]